MLRNLLQQHPEPVAQERFDTLVQQHGVKIERIVSHGQASPEGFWYDQGWDEWVLLLAGQAELEFEDRVLPMGAGDHVMIAAGKRHRVKSTHPSEPTIWLAVHWEGVAPTPPLVD